MDKIIVSSVGVFLIAGIYWFFFGKNSGEAGSGSARGADGSISIIVSGGYKPKYMKIPTNQTTKLIFIRKDSNTCLEDLVFPDFKIKKYLPMYTPVTVTLSPKKPGTVNFHCGMNMFHGTIEVSA
jgi:plastocyanin domain-containing protein